MTALPRRLFSPDECRALSRCVTCTWHTKTQGHHPDCSRRKR